MGGPARRRTRTRTGHRRSVARAAASPSRHNKRRIRRPQARQRPPPTIAYDRRHATTRHTHHRKRLDPHTQHAGPRTRHNTLATLPARRTIPQPDRNSQGPRNITQNTRPLRQRRPPLRNMGTTNPRLPRIRSHSVGTTTRKHTLPLTPHRRPRETPRKYPLGPPTNPKQPPPLCHTKARETTQMPEGSSLTGPLSHPGFAYPRTRIANANDKRQCQTLSAADPYALAVARHHVVSNVASWPVTLPH